MGSKLMQSQWRGFGLAFVALFLGGGSPFNAAAHEATPSSQPPAVTDAYRREVTAAIDARNRLFERNFASGNVEKLIDDYFVPDELQPIALGPHRPPTRGRAAIKDDFVRMRGSATSIKIGTIEVEVRGDMASEIGRVSLIAEDGTTRVGRYTVLWLKTNKGWLAKMDFFAPDAWKD
jgi:ketosteroid isomerase-like protein